MKKITVTNGEREWAYIGDKLRFQNDNVLRFFDQKKQCDCAIWTPSGHKFTIEEYEDDKRFFVELNGFAFVRFDDTDVILCSTELGFIDRAYKFETRKEAEKVATDIGGVVEEVMEVE